MRFLFLEPFYGGSHREFALGLTTHSKHPIDLATLPARYWKWRMRGASLYFIKKIEAFTDFDGIITSSLLSVSDLKSLIGPGCPPVLVYFHENQLTYPLAPGERLDLQYGFTDITTALSADRILFNSESHRRAFLDQLPRFIRRMPEHRPFWVVEAIAAKSAVLAPGCDFESAPRCLTLPDLSPPLIIWNHRWEFDKNPEAFFDALDTIRRTGTDFRLAVLGEKYSQVPPAFESAGRKLKDKIVHWGYVASRKAYYAWLARGAVVISTAIQENFGLAVVEAMRMGALPLLPRRLCYPEILPPAFHEDFLYDDDQDLTARLNRILTSYSDFRDRREALSNEMDRYAWHQVISKYDDELTKLGSRTGGINSISP